MGQTFSYRPKQYSVFELKKIANNFNTNLNRLIEEALSEKINKAGSVDKGNKGELLVDELSKVVYKFMGATMSIPDKKTRENIKKVVRENDKNGTWVKDDFRKRPTK